MRKFLVIGLGLAAGLLPVAANAAPILNVNFESGFGAFSPSGNVSIATGADYQPCCGTTGNTTNHFAAFGSGNQPSGLISDSFNTHAGAIYQIMFDFGALGSGTDPLTVTVGGVDHTFFPVADNNLDTTFHPGSFTFTGTGSPLTLSFTSAGVNNVDAIVDNIRVSGVPEPATWAMMIAGFGFIGGAVRYRNRKTRLSYATA